ncbi:MAG: uridine kinase [Planctomycetota bacterium]|nr:uridine kinase [Planctomycetota bacterium]
MNFLSIGIAGGTGSGKTTLAESLARAIGVDQDVVLIAQDSYYHDQSDLEMVDRASINYDHPDALELDLLTHHLEELRIGQGVEMPCYSFRTHCRKPNTQSIAPVSVAIVEGILIFQHAPTRNALDLKVFVDAPVETRMERRIRRDIEDRGRIESAARRQFEKTAQPMHEIFVEPSRHHADLIVSGLSPIESMVNEVLGLYLDMQHSA